MAGVPIDDALVRHLAALARLPLADADVAATRAHLTRLLDYVERLQGVDVGAAAAGGGDVGTGASACSPGLRDDAVMPSLPRDELLRAAPAHDGEHFLVPKLIEARK